MLHGVYALLPDSVRRLVDCYILADRLPDGTPAYSFLVDGDGDIWSACKSYRMISPLRERWCQHEWGAYFVRRSHILLPLLPTAILVAAKRATSHLETWHVTAGFNDDVATRSYGLRFSSDDGVDVSAGSPLWEQLLLPTIVFNATSCGLALLTDLLHLSTDEDYLSESSS